MRKRLAEFISGLKNNKKIAENYFFMTSLQIINSLFYFIIYPFIIRVVGPEEFGLYIFAMAITTYFVNIVSFGFDMPSIRIIAQNPNDRSVHVRVVSEIFTARTYLQIISTIVFIILCLVVPFFQDNLLLLSICFIQTFANVIFPRFYFDAIQKLKSITAMQALSKLITLPLMYFFIRNKDDIVIFALLNSIGVLIGALSAIILFYKDHKTIPYWCKFSSITKHFRIGFPFFLTQSLTMIKEQSVILIIGGVFGMREVAYYDLANKLVMVPRTFIMSINNALFPKIMKEWENKTRIKKIIQFEFVLGIMLVFAMIIGGKFVILLLGGVEMINSYYISMILSFTILSWLVVSAYINFIFIPQNKFYFITLNQIFALIGFTVFCLISVFVFKSIYALALSLALSGTLEIIFCYIIVKKYRLIE